MGHLWEGKNGPSELWSSSVLADWSPEDGSCSGCPLPWRSSGPGASVEREEEGVLFLSAADDVAVLRNRDLRSRGSNPRCLKPGSVASAGRTAGDYPLRRSF